MSSSKKFESECPLTGRITVIFLLSRVPICKTLTSKTMKRRQVECMLSHSVAAAERRDWSGNGGGAALVFASKCI